MKRFILVGNNEASFLGEGWYGLEKSPDHFYYRACGPLATIHLPGMKQRIRLSLILSARPEHAGEPLRVEVCSSSEEVWHLTVETNQWAVRTGELMLDSRANVEFRCLNPWSPDQIYKNGDVRSLGFLLNAMRIEETSKGSRPGAIWTSLQK